MAAGGGAGQPLVAVGVGPVLAFELVAGPGGDLLVVEFAGDGVAAQFGGGGDQRPGQGGAVPGALHEDGPAGAGLDAELVGAVVHDRGVAQRPGREVEAPGERGGVGAVVAEPAGLMAAGGDGGEDPGAGAAGVLDGPGENSGTGVASRAVPPSKAARSSSSRTETLASSSALTSDSSRSRAAVAWPGAMGLVRALSSLAVSRRFFGNGEGSATDTIAWKQYRTRR